ncbi:hypothetical protein JTB14_036382 [Gonioctena quinquepunctata]|nr:hypothetical protein JTB14_036382 [Gonioctena quinquepunctata]
MNILSNFVLSSEKWPANTNVCLDLDPTEITPRKSWKKHWERWLMVHCPFARRQDNSVFHLETLYNRFKEIYGSNPGRPTIFTHDEELAILKAAAKCADWRFPLSLLDMRMMAKYYSDRKGRTVYLFKNNLPGIDWTYSLLQQHEKSYGQRISTNIKRARASVSRETLGEFYNNLENTLRGLPSSNIFNYDESNLSDDPGKTRGIYRRGVKYPEKVMNHSKSCTTLMVCGAADGTLLPPYVIYRSVHLYDSWRENGPRGPPCCNKPCCSLGTRYNRTISGWMV